MLISGNGENFLIHATGLYRHGIHYTFASTLHNVYDCRPHVARFILHPHFFFSQWCAGLVAKGGGCGSASGGGAPPYGRPTRIGCVSILDGGNPE